MIVLFSWRHLSSTDYEQTVPGRLMTSANIKRKRNALANVPPIVLAMVAGFVIIVIATLFPEIEQTIIEIASAIR